jgi:hypothetical protein
MTEDSFNLDHELESLEKEFAPKFSKLAEEVPLDRGFESRLRQTLVAAVEQKEREQHQKKGRRWGWLTGFSSFPRNMKVVVSFALVIIMFTGLFLGLNKLGFLLNPQPVNAAEITLKALNQDSIGVDPGTAFVLYSSQPLEEKVVRETLKITPTFSYNLEKGAGGKEYRIIPQEKLAANTIYNFSFDPSGKGRKDFTWAFQTKGKFSVLRTLPGNNSVNVPVNSGVEIIFSHEDYSMDKIKDYVSISPQVEGRFEKHKKTLVFVPKELKPGQVYNVQVKKGLPLEGSSEVLAEDYVFSFETVPPGNEKETFSFEIDFRPAEFAAKEAPVFPVYFYGRKEFPLLSITVYRYPDSTAFKNALVKLDEVPQWAYYSRRQYKEDLSKLSKVAEYQTNFLRVDDYNHYAVFPEPLSPGYYAAELKAAGTTRQVWFQVTDLATYYAQGPDNAIFWVNDLGTKKPAETVTINIDGLNNTFKGDAKGVCLVDAPLIKDKTGYALIKNKDKEILVSLEAGGMAYYLREGKERQDYWKYLYLDRELYLPGDVVHFWGVLAPRAQNSQELKEVVIQLKGSDGPLYGGAEDAPITEKRIALTGNTFTGQIRLPVLKPGYYYINIKAGETVFLSRGFSVQTYQKPAYEITVDPMKKAIFAGEKTEFKVKAAFFEGTPVPNMSLNYHIDGSNRKTVTTDEKGEGVIPYTAPQGHDHYSLFHFSYLGVHSNLPEAGEIMATSGVYVFKSKVHLSGEAKRQGESFTLKAKLREVDLSGINDGDYPREETYLKGPVANTLVKGSIYQDVWQKVEAGERYDFINKRVEKIYHYNHSTKHVADFNMVTDANGEATYSGANLDPKSTYFIELSAEDKEGRQIKNRYPLYSSEDISYNTYSYYHLQNEEQGRVGYTAGEEVSLKFVNNQKQLPSRENGFLYFQARNKIDQYQVLNSSRYTFTFQKEHVPNVNVFAVYFDGNGYHTTYHYPVPFARDTKMLKVTIETDKTAYRPQDKVKLKVTVKDRENKPVQAKVNLNLVDEAFYKLQNQHVNFLDSLYGDYIIPMVNIRYTHYHLDLHGGAEQGGEGDSERKDFRDNVLFTTLETDKQGVARTEFQLPDNLTSWRVTYHALTAGLEAASGTAKIPVRLPFFVDLVLNDTYFAGDRPAAVVRSFGEMLHPQAAVSYEMKLITPAGEEITRKEQGKAFTPVDLVLPELTEGKYKITVKGSIGEQQDILTKEFTVVKSYLERTISRHDLLRTDLQLQGSSTEPTTLIFSDYEKSQYLTALYSLSWVDGSRVEQKLTKQGAQKLLSQYFPENSLREGGKDDSLLQYQKPDGGISILPYGESEPYLTALVAVYEADQFDKTALARYLYRILEGDKQKEEDKSLALWGLAALKEPVLLEINKQLQEKNLEPAVKIRLAMALLELGNGAYAKEVFQELITKYGEDLGPTLRIKTGRDQDEIIEATTQMALLAASFDRPEKHKLYQYILENPGKDVLNTLEQLQIMKYNLRYMNPKPVSFTYELRGRKETITLKDQQTFKLTLLPEDLNTIKFSNIEGKVGVMSLYTKPYSADEIKPQEGLAIARSYNVNKRATNTMGRTDLVQVVISFDIGDKAPAGSYEIVDILPAGLRYVERPYVYGEKFTNYWSYPTEVKGQKLTFHVGKGREKIVYYARVISPGEFTAQAPLLAHSKSNKISILGNEGRVIIK